MAIPIKTTEQLGGSNSIVTPNTATNDTITLKAGEMQTIQLFTAQATTSGTFVDFTGIPSNAKKITVMFSNGSTSGTSGVIVQLGSGTIATTGYIGTNGVFYTTNIAGAISITNGIALKYSSVAAETFRGEVALKTFGGNIWLGTSICSGTNYPEVFAGSGEITLAGTLDRIRITTVNGTDIFDAGSVNILVEC